MNILSFFVSFSGDVPQETQHLVDFRSFVRRVKWAPHSCSRSSTPIPPPQNVFVCACGSSTGLLLNYCQWDAHEPVHGYVLLSPDLSRSDHSLAASEVEARMAAQFGMRISRPNIFQRHMSRFGKQPASGGAGIVTQLSLSFCFLFLLCTTLFLFFFVILFLSSHFVILFLSSSLYSLSLSCSNYLFALIYLEALSFTSLPADLAEALPFSPQDVSFTAEACKSFKYFHGNSGSFPPTNSSVWITQ